MKHIAKVIKDEADECSKSADDMRNTPQNREIFHVVSIVLNGIAAKLTSAKYCDDPDNCTYSDCPTAFCDKPTR